MTTTTPSLEAGAPASRAGGSRRIPALVALARFELAAQARGRTLPVFAAGFGLAALGVALAGLSAGGSLVVQGFARTSVSLLQLTLWLVPLVALADAALAAADGCEMELLAAQPVSRGVLLAGRALGRFGAIAAALLLGYGAAGLLIASTAGPGDAARFLGLLAVAVALAAAATALGTLTGVLARSRARALAAAVGLWFVLAVGYDLAVIAILSLLPRAELTWTLSALLLMSPVDSARAIGTSLFEAETFAGPLGAALRRVLGPAGVAVLWAGLAAWTAVPLAVAARVFANRDL